MSTTPPRPGTAHWRALTPAAPASRTTPLALGVELRRRDAASGAHWAPRALSSASARQLVKDPGELVLAVRPLVRSSATESWIQSDASWDAVRRVSSRFDRAQSRWFADLLSIARDSLLSGTSGDWLPLDPIESRLLWPHLRDAAARGLELVATQKGTTVAFAGDVRVGADLNRSSDGALSVAAAVNLDGHSFDVANVRPIGHTGVYGYEVVGGNVHLAFGSAVLSESAHALLTAHARIEIAETEETAFFTEAFPALARSLSVTAGALVSLPQLPEPEPVVTVAFRPGDRVDFRVEWEYAGYGRFPMAATIDAVRDAAAEEHATAALVHSWTTATGIDFVSTGSLVGVDAAEFVAHGIPALEGDGIPVVVTGKRRQYHELTGEPEITISTVESTDPDWFDLGIIVRIDGRSIPFTPLFTALSMRRTKLLMVDGTYFSLAHPALQRLRDLIDEAVDLDEWETGPRINRHQTALWADFEDLAHEAIPAVRWRETVHALRTAESVPSTAVPDALHAELRPYQKAGFDWLAFLWTHRLGGILADDMGLGKTIQLLTLMLHARATGENRPFLVVAPTSVISTWQQEAARFAPSLTSHLIRAAPRRKDLAADVDLDLVIASYAIVRRHQKTFQQREWALLVLDEAQFVKNPGTLQHQAVAGLDAETVFAVTGTPMENSLADLWALLNLSAPGLFPSARRFKERYIQPIELGKVPENAEGGDYRKRRLAELRRRIRPLVLRRTKDLVAPELPPKQEQQLFIELSTTHRAIYDTVLQRERQKVLGLLADLDRNRFIVFRSITLLRMLALAPGLVDPEDAGVRSRKLDALVEHITEMHAEGHRALVFSQFTSYLALAADRLRAAGIDVVQLDGTTRDRDAVVNAYRTGDAPVFLISLKAGGFGLTLTEADYVFLLDPWWTPAAEEQAIDRTHRIGQTRPVNVYRMISAGTIEEKVVELQERKARLFSAVMDDDDLFAQSLSADDIRGLFDA